MNPWRPYPLIRLAAAFAAGILAAILRVSDVRIPPLALALLLLPVLAFAAFPGLLSAYRLRWIPGAFIYLAFTVTAFQFAVDARPGYFRMDHLQPPEREGTLLARVREQPAARSKSVRLAADLWLRDTVSGSFGYFGTGLLYLQKDPRSQHLATGDLILLAGEPGLLPGPPVPGGFDMRGWFGRKGIFYRLYAPSGKWKYVARDPSFSIRRTAEGVRDRLLEILRENNVNGEEFSVAAALLLGYVTEMDRELLSDYSSSGAMHILSVSGMHVGVIYLFLEFLLGFLERRKRNGGIASWLKAAVMVASIWSYAVLTGLSPPVQRAAIMLSMVIIGKNMQRQPEILNILAASLFIILVSDPFLLADTGCQFSYLAVAGIVLLYQPIYDLYVTSKWFPDKLWSLAAVSVAAQLITFPLGLYVFHQFPNYFLLTNILAVPLSSIIIYTGILLLAVSPVPWLGAYTGKALSWMVWLLNQVVRFIDGLPGSVMKGVFLTLPEMLLLYAVVAFVFLFFLQKRKSWLFLVLVCLVLLSGSFLARRIRSREREQVVVYQDRTTLVDFISGDRHFLLTGNPLVPAGPDAGCRIQDYYASIGVMDHFSGYLYPGMTGAPVRNIPGFILRKGNFFLFGKYRLVVVNKALPPGIRKPFGTDILVLSGNPKMNMADILKVFKAKQVVVDGSNAGWRIKAWEREAENLGIRVHVTSRDGVFSVKSEE